MDTSIRELVKNAVQSAPIHDIHTHLFPPQFGSLCLAGIDELLTYHYLVAEYLRVAGSEDACDAYWNQPKARQADLIWQHLFIERSPISEATRGVICCLKTLGLDPNEKDLSVLRKAFESLDIQQRLNRVLDLSGVETVVMTNDPLDPDEHPLWTDPLQYDSRFKTVLRLDRFFADWPKAIETLKAEGYSVTSDLNETTFTEVRRYIADWIEKLSPLYIALSLPPEFRYPSPDLDARIIEHCIIPVALETDLPLALMIGCRRQINTRLHLAGDGVGFADLSAMSNLCDANPQNRFLCTVLSRENQHELAVIARNFANLHVFGCWWFVNTLGLAEEITRMRIELLGHSFTPQHSDARVLEQLIYKWSDTREMLTRVLTGKYTELATQGYMITTEQVENEASEYLGNGAMRFIQGTKQGRDG